MNTYKLIVFVSLLTCLALAASTIGQTNCLPGTSPEHTAPKSRIVTQCKSAAAFMLPVVSVENGTESVALASDILSH